MAEEPLRGIEAEVPSLRGFCQKVKVCDGTEAALDFRDADRVHELSEDLYSHMKLRQLPDVHAQLRRLKEAFYRSGVVKGKVEAEIVESSFALPSDKQSIARCLRAGQRNAIRRVLSRVKGFSHQKITQRISEAGWSLQQLK